MRVDESLIKPSKLNLISLPEVTAQMLGRFMTISDVAFKAEKSLKHLMEQYEL